MLFLQALYGKGLNVGGLGAFELHTGAQSFAVIMCVQNWPVAIFLFPKSYPNVGSCVFRMFSAPETCGKVQNSCLCLLERNRKNSDTR